MDLDANRSLIAGALGRIPDGDRTALQTVYRLTSAKFFGVCLRIFGFAESMVGQGDDRQLAMQPSRLSEFITLVRERFEEAAREGEAPVLVTSANIRPYVRGIVERFRAQTPVLSQSEIHPRSRLKTVGSI